jgi:hypothetical protein
MLLACPKSKLTLQIGTSWEALSLVVCRRLSLNLGGGDVAVTQEFLNLADIDAGIAAVGALSMVAGAAGDPAFEQLGDAGKEAFGPGAEPRSQVAGEDGRQLVGIPQDDQVAIAGRSLGSVAHEYRVPKGG